MQTRSAYGREVARRCSTQSQTADFVCSASPACFGRQSDRSHHGKRKDLVRVEEAARGSNAGAPVGIGTVCGGTKVAARTSFNVTLKTNEKASPCSRIFSASSALSLSRCNKNKHLTQRGGVATKGNFHFLSTDLPLFSAPVPEGRHCVAHPALGEVGAHVPGIRSPGGATTALTCAAPTGFRLIWPRRIPPVSRVGYDCRPCGTGERDQIETEATLNSSRHAKNLRISSAENTEKKQRR